MCASQCGVSSDKTAPECVCMCVSLSLCVSVSVCLSLFLCLCLYVSEQHSCIQTGLGKTLCPRTYTSCHCLAIQGKISSSTLALRAALVAQQSAQQSAVSGLSVAAGCNRTADMQYFFVVSLHAFALHCTTFLPLNPEFRHVCSVMLVLSCWFCHVGSVLLACPCCYTGCITNI